MGVNQNNEDHSHLLWLVWSHPARLWPVIMHLFWHYLVLGFCWFSNWCGAEPHRLMPVFTHSKNVCPTVWAQNAIHRNRKQSFTRTPKWFLQRIWQQHQRSVCNIPKMLRSKNNCSETVRNSPSWHEQHRSTFHNGSKTLQRIFYNQNTLNSK